MEEALATNLGLGRLSDVLDAKRNVRETELDRLRKDYPNYIEDIDATLAAFDAWSKWWARFARGFDRLETFAAWCGCLGIPNPR
ncbi:MAG: hypothetical protein R3E58_13020 [Phycisphaerae bacterium]